VPREAVCCKKCKHSLPEKRNERETRRKKGRKESGRQRKKIRMTAGMASRRGGGGSLSACAADCSRFWRVDGGVIASLRALNELQKT